MRKNSNEKISTTRLHVFYIKVKTMWKRAKTEVRVEKRVLIDARGSERGTALRPYLEGRGTHSAQTPSETPHYIQCFTHYGTAEYPNYPPLSRDIATVETHGVMSCLIYLAARLCLSL